MALQGTDYININRGGTPGDGSSGTYYVAQIDDLRDLLVNDLVPEIISSDANNALAAGSDDKLFIRNAAVTDDATNGQFKFTGNTGADTTVSKTGWMAGATAP